MELQHMLYVLCCMQSHQANKIKSHYFQTEPKAEKMTKVQRLREVTVNLVRMDLRRTSGESLEIMENNKARDSSERKRKAEEDLRRQELDEAEKKARIEVLTMLGLGDLLADEEREQVCRKTIAPTQSQRQVPRHEGYEVKQIKEETLLMEMQDIFNDLHDFN